MIAPAGGERAGAELPPGLLLRRMTLDDLDSVMEIAREGFTNPWSPELMKREMIHEWSTVLVATSRQEPGAPERVLGFLVFWLVHDEVHVLNVAIALSARRKGVGRALMREAAERGRAGKAILATLEVRRSNTPAITLYEELGYRQVGIRVNYYADEGEDAIVMVLDL